MTPLPFAFVLDPLAAVHIAPEAWAAVISVFDGLDDVQLESEYFRIVAEPSAYLVAL